MKLLSLIGGLLRRDGRGLGRVALPGACAAFGLLLAGCNIIPAPAADPTRYYVLSGPAASPSGAQPISGSLRVGLRAVELAPYLKKGVIVVRTGDNEVTYPNEARWGEPLEREVLNSLRNRLLAAPTVGRVFTPPFPFDEPRDYDVSVRVTQCEGVRPAGGGAASVSFAATLEITATGAAGAVVARRTFVAPAARWDGRDYGRLAAEISLAVGALGQVVVEALPAKP